MLRCHVLEYIAYLIHFFYFFNPHIEQLCFVTCDKMEMETVCNLRWDQMCPTPVEECEDCVTRLWAASSASEWWPLRLLYLLLQRWCRQQPSYTVGQQNMGPLNCLLSMIQGGVGVVFSNSWPTSRASHCLWPGPALLASGIRHGRGGIGKCWRQPNRQQPRKL